MRWKYVLSITIALFVGGVVWLFWVLGPEDKIPLGTPPGSDTQAPPLPPAFQEIINQIQRHFAAAHIAFNIPTSLKLGEITQIALLLSLRESIDELIKKLNRRPGVMYLGEREGADVLVSNRMEARLTGPGFTITAITPEAQVVGVLETTEWRWTVKAVTPGQQFLHLTLSAVFALPDKSPTSLAVHTFDKRIDVTVSWYDPVIAFIGSNWQWLCTTLLLPVVGWLCGRYFRRKSSDVSIS
jgi:hypothetical protein